MTFLEIIDYIDALQLFAAATGIIGAYYVGSRERARQELGWKFFAMSNGFWLYWGVSHHAWWLLAMQAFYVGTSARGWFNTSTAIEDADKARYYFEAHVTVDPVGIRLNEFVNLCAIHGFHVAKLYMDKGGSLQPSDLDTFTTSRDTRLSTLKASMTALIDALRIRGFVVRRFKIEDTILDSRFGEQTLQESAR